MSRKLQAAAITGLVAFTALLCWIERPFRTPTPPDPVKVAEMLGRDPGVPDHEYWGPGQILWSRIQIFFRDLGSALPLGMYLIPQGDVWTYRFPASATYRPPGAYLDCEVESGIADNGLYCKHTVKKAGKSWTYTLSRLEHEDSALFVVRVWDPDNS
jgi:hypothetical protein